MFDLITIKLEEAALQQLASAPFVFTRNGIILVLYVDDLLVFGNTRKDLAKLQNKLGKELIIQALGKPTSFLGIEMSSHKDAVYWSRRRLKNKLLENRNMAEYKRMKTSMSNSKNQVGDNQLRLSDEEST